MLSRYTFSTRTLLRPYGLSTPTRADTRQPHGHLAHTSANLLSLPSHVEATVASGTRAEHEHTRSAGPRPPRRTTCLRPPLRAACGHPLQQRSRPMGDHAPPTTPDALPTPRRHRHTPHPGVRPFGYHSPLRSTAPTGGAIGRPTDRSPLPAAITSTATGSPGLAPTPFGLQRTRPRRTRPSPPRTMTAAHRRDECPCSAI